MMFILRSFRKLIIKPVAAPSEAKRNSMLFSLHIDRISPKSLAPTLAPLLFPTYLIELVLAPVLDYQRNHRHPTASGCDGSRCWRSLQRHSLQHTDLDKRSSAEE